MIKNEIFIKTLAHSSDFENMLDSLLENEGYCIDILYPISQYQLGSARDGSTIYWQIDEMGNVHDGRLYKMEGSARLISEMMHIDSTPCLFGQHLLTQYPDKPIGLTLMELDAVMMALAYPDMLWLSIAEQEASKELLKPLQGRKTIYFARDIEDFIKWDVSSIPLYQAELEEDLLRTQISLLLTDLRAYANVLKNAPEGTLKREVMAEMRKDMSYINNRMVV